MSTPVPVPARPHLSVVPAPRPVPGRRQTSRVAPALVPVLVPSRSPARWPAGAGSVPDLPTEGSGEREEPARPVGHDAAGSTAPNPSAPVRTQAHSALAAQVPFTIVVSATAFADVTASALPPRIAHEVQGDAASASFLDQSASGHESAVASTRTC